MRLAALVAAAVLGAAGAWGGIQGGGVPAERRDRLGVQLDVTAVPGLHLGVPGLVAGVMWLRVVNDFGEWWHRSLLDRARDDYLNTAIGRILRLEPEMLDPALFVADVLASRGGQVEGAYTALLHGLSGQTGRWELYFRLGYLAYRHFGLPNLAADWWLLTGQLPGRPDYLPVLAQMIRLHRTGNLDAILGEISVATVRDPVLRQEVGEAEAFRALAKRLAPDLALFASRMGRPATHPTALVAAGIWSAVPRDPWGSEIRLGPDGVLPGSRLPIHLRVWPDQVTAPPAVLRGDALRGWRPVL